jgi:transposase-like protein
MEPEMRARELKQLLTLTAKLTPSQREQLMAHLGSGLALDEVSSVVQGAMAQHPGCPKCQAAGVVRNGQAGGLQRYKCRTCGVTFNALSGTPLARLRHRDRWLEQARAMDEGLSVRKAAAGMLVHRTTAFRWRHRFLALPREVKASSLAGVAEADETYVLRSYKGQRRELLAEQVRKPRHRGGKAAKRGLSAEQVPILVVRNRAGQTTDQVLEVANKRCVAEVLQPALADDAVLCTDGSGMLAKVASELGIEHHAVNTLKGEHTRGAWHIQNVNAYHSRFKQWMRRFNGVATSYLPNYLGWFRALDRNVQSGAKPASLLALAVGA